MAAILVFSANFALWTIIGLGWLLEESGRKAAAAPAVPVPSMTVQDVAVLIPVHNEGMVLGSGLYLGPRQPLRLHPPNQALGPGTLANSATIILGRGLE